MKEPVLVVMAAGMGSRYGGLKQMDPVDEYGHSIIDFSIYDAVRAGFRKVVFIIKRSIEADFKEKVGNRISGAVEVSYVFQNIGNLPSGYTAPAERVKPWGTGHAVLSCLGTVNGPFAVINSDDYYGIGAFKMLYDYLSAAGDDEKYRYAMVGYVLGNTLTENGHVSRGVCRTDENGFLRGINERTHIEKRDGKAQYTEDGVHWEILPEESTVSMNMWGFTESVLPELENRFVAFLEEKAAENPLKAEYFLPEVVGALLEEEKATVRVLKSFDKWYGVTYKEDKPVVVEAIAGLKKKGLYPEKLWERK